MSIISKELNYESKTIEHGTYSYSKILPQSSVPIVLNVAGGQQTVFEVPANTINFCKSSLNFTVVVPASAGTKTNKLNNVGAPMLRSISVQTRAGLFLCDIQEVNRYLSLVLPAESRGSEWTGNDSPIDAKYVVSGINRTTTGAVGNQQIGGIVYSNTNADTFTPLYTGLQHTIQGAVDATTTLRYSLPFSLFKNSILSMDLDQYFGGESVFLNLTWASRNYIGHIGTADVDTGVADLTGDVPVSNLFLNMAVETNVVAQQVARASKSYTIPYVYSNKLTFTNLGLQSLQVRYNRSQGSKLRKIYWGSFAVSEANQYAFTHHNKAAGVTSTFYSLLNNNRLQQFNPVCAELEDFMLLKDKLKDTPLENARAYYQNYIWIEDFTSGTIMYDGAYLTDGFELSEDALWTMNVTNSDASGRTHQAFSVTERVLTLQDGMITIS